MFRHVVLLRWVPEATPDEVLALERAFTALPGLVPEIRSYVFGTDAGINEGNFDEVVVADFDSVDDYLVYRDHPDHVALINDLIRPILAERAAVQHEI